VTLTRAEVVALLDAHGLRPSRALGQNFVVDPNTVRRIVRLAELGPGARVVEIGAGLGSLTLALAEAGAEVTAVELDRHLVPILRDVVARHPGVEVVQADALRLDWSRLLEGHRVAGPGEPGTWALVGNLPYNVATPLVLRALAEAPSIGSMLVMVQREVGERLAAGARSAAYGAVSAKVAYWASAAVVGRVPASVFLPRPRVESVLVRLRRRQTPAVRAELVGRERLFAVVEAGFAQRRKMLRRSLDGVVDPDAFVRAGVAPQSRAEELSIEQWGRLAAQPAGAR
jgi:16S rRNA (adenine1518-N6/adenine1519-N6)-dimethyltransferase